MSCALCWFSMIVELQRYQAGSVNIQPLYHFEVLSTCKTLVFYFVIVGDWRTIESKRQSIHGCPHFYFPHANVFSLQESAWAHAPGKTVPLATPWKNNVANFRLGIVHCPCSLQPSAWCMPQVDLPVTHARRKIAWLGQGSHSCAAPRPIYHLQPRQDPFARASTCWSFSGDCVAQNFCLESLSGHACR